MTPRVSLIVLGYNQADYIEQAIESAFGQTYSPLEIVLSDDCSSDSTYSIMLDSAARYSGPHEVVVNRTKQNVGVVQHFTEVVRNATGEAVVYMAGDDVSLPCRVEFLVPVLFGRDDVAFVESKFREFTRASDVEGQLRVSPLDDEQKQESLSRRSVEFTLHDYMNGGAPALSSSTRAFRRRRYMRFPDLDSRLPSEDTSTALRLLFTGSGRKLESELLLRRRHAANLTRPEVLKNIDYGLILEQYLADIVYAVEHGLLTPQDGHAVSQWAKRTTERRRLRVIFDFGSPTWRQLFLEIIPSESLTMREKVAAGRRFLRGLFPEL